MKKTYLLCGVLLGTLVSAQIPSGYYNDASGKKGATLKSALSAIVNNGAQDKGYNGLWTGYATTDRDYFLKDDGKILDMYSKNPYGADPYTFTYSTNQCGSYSVEGDCYNREHVVPQSFFNEGYPMKSDINFIRATDGKVNGMRSNYPYGVVNSPSWTSKNGSKLGNNSTSGYSGTVFEPLDYFKGDVARMILYFVTRYENKLSGFSSGNMLGNTPYPGLQTWELEVLLAWHKADPVSIEEVSRNNASYVYQSNRNPFIDHPEYVDLIWGPAQTDTQAPTVPTNLATVDVRKTAITLGWTASTDNDQVFEYDVYADGILKSTSKQNKAVVYGLNPNQNYAFTVKARDVAGNVSAQSSVLNATTLPDTTSNGSSCGYENFDQFAINTTSHQYNTRTWTNNGLSWNATQARVDQLVNNSPAITLKNGTIKVNANNGVETLTVTTQAKFANVSGNYVLKINGVQKGLIPYSSTPVTTTISGINTAGNNVEILLEEQNASSTNRVAFNNLSWTCFASLGTSDVDASSSKLSVYPNPVKNSEIFIKGIKGTEDIQIFNTNGELVQSLRGVKSNERIALKKLTSGVYILKTKINLPNLL